MEVRRRTVGDHRLRPTGPMPDSDDPHRSDMVLRLDRRDPLRTPLGAGAADSWRPQGGAPSALAPLFPAPLPSPGGSRLGRPILGRPILGRHPRPGRAPCPPNPRRHHRAERLARLQPPAPVSAPFHAAHGGGVRPVASVQPDSRISGRPPSNDRADPHALARRAAERPIPSLLTRRPTELERTCAPGHRSRGRRRRPHLHLAGMEPDL